MDSFVNRTGCGNGASFVFRFHVSFVSFAAERDGKLSIAFGAELVGRKEMTWNVMFSFCSQGRCPFGHPP